MNETAKIYSDNYGAVFAEERGFLDFLTERADNAWWKKEPVKEEPSGQVMTPFP